MMYFGIPLRSKQVSNDWDRVCELFNRTLNSVYNQTNKNFKIIIACHEIPKLNKIYDSRVEFIQVKAPIPNSREEMMIDKGYKVHTIAIRVRELGGGFTMLVDADDLISNRICEYVNNNSEKNGFISNKGYYYNFGENFIKKGFKFPNGSSTIVKYSIDDLPFDYDEIITDNNKENKYIIRQKHNDIPKKCKALGRELSNLPFIASIYVRDTGENHSLMGRDKSVFRKFEQHIMPKIRINDKIREEFSIDWM